MTVVYYGIVQLHGNGKTAAHTAAKQARHKPRERAGTCRHRAASGVCGQGIAATARVPNMQTIDGERVRGRVEGAQEVVVHTGLHLAGAQSRLARMPSREPQQAR